MANTEKSKAELYREERKARLAKAAKKRTKAKMSNGAKAVISVAVIVALILGICGYSFVSLGVSRQFDDVYSIEGADAVSYAEYTYYYNQIFSNYFNTAAQYEQYYSSMYGAGAGSMLMGGYDYTTSPELQQLPESHTDYAAVKEAGYENPTWADYFDYGARRQVAQIKVLCKMADEAGYKLSDEGKAEIKEAYDSMKNAAGQAAVSVNKYLSYYYGKGVTKGLVKKVIEEQTTAKYYQDVLKEQYRAELTTDEIEANYKENKATYDVADVAFYTVSAETVKAKDENGEETESVTSKTMKAAKEKAEAIAEAKSYKEFSKLVDGVAGAKNSATLQKGLTKDSLSQYVGTEIAEWLFGSKVKVGDIKVSEQSGAGYVVCYAYSLPTRDETKMVDLRQIAFEIPEEEEEAAPTEDAETEEKSEEDIAAEEAAKKAEEEAAAKKAEEDANTPALDTFTDAPVFNDVAKKTADKDTYKDAELTLRKFLNGDRSEESFKALADEKDGADAESEEYTDSSLIEKAYPNSGSLDENVEKWAFDESRKAGDVGIIESDGTYYLVFFKATLDEANWEMNVKDNLAYEKIDGDVNSHEAKVLDEAKIKSVIDYTMEFAKKQIAALASQQQNAAY